MAAPRAFISFDFDNNEKHRALFVGQAANSRTPFEIQDWSSKSALPQSQWEALIEDKLSRCHLAVVLVGRSTYSAVGVAKEIDMAARAAVPFFGIYVDSATDLTPLPPGLARNRVISWTWDGVASAIDQMMGEGKNR